MRGAIRSSWIAGLWTGLSWLSTADWPRQRKAVLRALRMPFTPALLLLAAAYLQPAVPIGELVADTASVAGLPFHVGLLSSLGIVLWGAAAALCFFAWATSRGSLGGEWRGFLLASGVLSSVLTLDDMAQLHEAVLPVYLGVPQIAVYSAYALSALVYLVAFRETILRTEFSLLAIALALFTASTAIDVVSGSEWLAELRGVRATEEGLKLLGIVGWLTYFARSCATAMKMVPAGG